MREIDFGDISVETFLKDYWQQKPLLIKKAFKQFVDPISSDELAGLASEEIVESRLIINPHHDSGSGTGKSSWSAQLGPFEDYTEFGEENWTLVVQSVNHFDDDVQKFSELFQLIPQWRFDDVMVSFATKNGGVGPHIDFYDVFICQGSGKRRWRVGDKGSHKEVIAHEKLKHVEDFSAIIDDIVEAGDVLYIPPNFPHEGISLNDSMSFSIGYKSTNSNEFVSGLADYLLDKVDKPNYLSDAGRSLCDFNKMPISDFVRIKEFLLQTISDDELLTKFVGKYYSENSHELDLITTDFTSEEWLELFRNQPLLRCNGLKIMFLENDILPNRLFVNGHALIIDNLSLATKQVICSQTLINYEDIFSELDNSYFLSKMTQLTNLGYWYFAQ